MVASCREDLRHRLHPAARRSASARSSRGDQSAGFDGPGGRTDLRRTVEWLGEAALPLSLLIEAGSKLNWAALEARGGGQDFLLLRAEDSGWNRIALPMAGGVGRRRRIDAIRFARSEAARYFERRIRR